MKVCVVGGGPAGMVLGLLLARAGIEVDVLEKHEDFLRDFRGDTVHPPTLELLDDLGLGERFAALPNSYIDQVRVPWRGGTVQVADLTRLRGKHKHIAMVPQWDFLNLLASAAAKEPTFTLRMRTEATGLLRSGARVTGIEYSSPDGPGRIEADLVVACDGRSSRLRTLAGLHPKSYPTPMDVWWFRIPREETDPSGVMALISASRAAIMLDRKDYWQSATLIAKGSDETSRKAPVSTLVESLAAVAPWLGDRVSAIKSWDDVKTLDVKLDRLPRWHVEGLLCIGDAAHAMSPVGGVGINLAVQDAIATARLLAAPLRRGTLSSSDLARVQRRRLVPTLAVQGFQRVIHRMAVRPAVAGEVEVVGATKLPLPLRLLSKVSSLRALPAILVARGLLTERTPDFARR